MAYPSIAEGFGLPVLEAMASGADVLTTDRLAIPEVGGDAVHVHRAGRRPHPHRAGRTARRRPADRRDRRRAHAGEPTGSPGRPVPRAPRGVPVSGEAAARARDRHRLLQLRRRPRRRSSPRPRRARTDVPVVVADNDSADADALRAVTEAAGATFLALGENRGYGGAVNRAVATLDPAVRWVLVSNPDVVLEPGALDRLRRDRGERPGHRCHRPRRCSNPTARSTPPPASCRPSGPGSDTRCSRTSGPATRGPGGTGRTAREGQRDAGWLSGACVLVRRRRPRPARRLRRGLLHVLRGRRPRLAHRTTRTAGTCTSPRATATHIGGTATQGSSERMRRAHHESAYRFLATEVPGLVAVAAPARAPCCPRCARPRHEDPLTRYRRSIDAALPRRPSTDPEDPHP